MSEDSPENENVRGGTGITAGRDVSIGDVTGQSAIGEYINQFMIKKPSGDTLIKLMAYLEQKRQETANLEILNSYSSSALPYYPPRLKEFVVKNREDELSKALFYLQDHRILLFTGIGGIGKTTLARALVETRPANVPAPFWFDFRQNQDAKVGDILERLAGYMNSPDIAKFRDEKREAEEEDINKLTDKLQERKPVWLIFDNLETIQDGIDFCDEHMDLLFTCLRNNTHEAKLITISRTSPRLKNGNYLIDVTVGERQDVKGLKINFAVDYLVKNGLTDVEPDKLEKLAVLVDGHPLALNFLVSLVKKLGVNDILEFLGMYQEHTEDTVLKVKKLFDKLAGDEKELLERISVYREPVSIKGLKNMFTEKTSENLVKNLIDESLLEIDHRSRYRLHPLVQEFAYDRLENKKEIHRLAVKYYLSVPLPELTIKKEDIQSLIEAHHHACLAEEFDQAFHIIFDNHLHEYLDSWGNYSVLVDLYSKLLPKNPFANGTLLKDREAHGLIIGKLGIAYQHLGELNKAIEYQKQALKIFREMGNRLKEGIWLGNLGNAYRDLGDPKKAIKYYEQALKSYKDVGDKIEEGIWLENLKSAYGVLDESKKVIEHYEQALSIGKKLVNWKNKK